MNQVLTESATWALDVRNGKTWLHLDSPVFLASQGGLTVRLPPDILDAIAVAHAARQFPHQAGIPASFDAACRDVTSNAVIDFDLAVTTRPPEQKEGKADGGRDRGND